MPELELLEQDARGAAPGQGPCRRRADDAGADHDRVDPFHGAIVCEKIPPDAKEAA
jgi:hypothetical protein